MDVALTIASDEAEAPPKDGADDEQQQQGVEVMEEKQKLRPHLSRSTSARQYHTYSVITHSIDKQGNLSSCHVSTALEAVNQRAEAAATTSTTSTATSTATSTTAVNDEDVSYWIDAEIELVMNDESKDFSIKQGESPDFAKLREHVLSKLRLSPFLHRQLNYRTLTASSQFIALPRFALVSVRIWPDDEYFSSSSGGSSNCSSSRYTQYAAALLEKGLFFTISFLPPPDNRDSSRAFRGGIKTDAFTSISERELPQASVTGALTVWLLFHANHLATVTNRLRLEVFNLLEKIENDGGSISLGDIIAVSDKVMHVIAVAEEQSECITSLVEGQELTAAIDFTPFEGFKGLLLSTSGATERMALRLEKRVADLRQSYDTEQQKRINRRLNVLTILSAVFLPLTLMAGIWGMNFVNMPELEKENGYYFALMAMVVVGLSLVFTFYYCGWFE